jgi:predicted transglutaminase-like cysteine proteinase
MIYFLSICTVFAALDLTAEFLSKIEQKYGIKAVNRIQQWQQLMHRAKQLPEQEKLKRVNDFFNQQIKFIDDIRLWGVTDYWATPMELLFKGAGDCEDYSIAKYFTLLDLGVADNKMRITYVKALNLNQAHMVLTYYSSPKSVPIVLDNLIPVIKSANKRKDLLPVYSFNGSGLWLAKSSGNGKKVGSSQRINLWAALKQRMINNPLK